MAKRRERQRWPYIRQRIYPNGSKAWMVDARTANGGERKSFGTLQEAQTYADGCRIRRKNEGNAAFGNEELARYGKTVQDAISFYLAHLRQQAQSIPLEDAVSELIGIRRKSGLSSDYCDGLEIRLGKFKTMFPAKSVASFTQKELDEWFTSLRYAPATRNTFRRDVMTLFSFCHSRGYINSNPAAGTAVAADFDKPVEILTVAQAKALLNACTDDVRAYAAIGLFAGLRCAEVEKLDWSEIDLEGGMIEVKAHKAKTKRRRLVKVADNLRVWLNPLAEMSGPVIGANFRRRWNAALERARFRARLTDHNAKLAVWPRNALRHSYGSYWLAQHQDTAALALQMGNSPAMVFAHYRELVKTKQAAEYWSILPPS